MNRRLKIFLLSVFLLSLCYVIFVLVVGINYASPPAKKTLKEKKMIASWKQKGVKIDFGHRIEDKHRFRGGIFVRLDKMNPPKKEAPKDSLDKLILDIHRDFLKATNPKYKYDSLLYVIYFNPNVDYNKDTSLLYNYQKQLKGNFKE